MSHEIPKCDILVHLGASLHAGAAWELRELTVSACTPETTELDSDEFSYVEYHVRVESPESHRLRKETEVTLSDGSKVGMFHGKVLTSRFWPGLGSISQDFLVEPGSVVTARCRLSSMDSPPIDGPWAEAAPLTVGKADEQAS